MGLILMCDTTFIAFLMLVWFTDLVLRPLELLGTSKWIPFYGTLSKSFNVNDFRAKILLSDFGQSQSNFPRFWLKSDLKPCTNSCRAHRSTCQKSKFLSFGEIIFRK